MMRFYFLLFILFLFSSEILTQAPLNDCQRCGFEASFEYCENFDFHPLGDLDPGSITGYNVFQSTSGNRAEIVELDNDQADYPINRAMKMTGSIVDFLISRPLGQKPKRVEMLIKVGNGKAGEVQLFLNSSFIPVNVKFNQNGTISGSGYTAYYTQGAWQRLVFILQPEENEVEIFVNNVYQGKATILRDDNTTIDRIRFTNAGLNGSIELYVDHIAYVETELTHSGCLSGQIVRVNGPGINECLEFESLQCANSFGYSDCETVSGQCQGIVCPTEFSPKDGATDVSLNPIIQWVGGGQATEFRISMGYSPSNFDIANNISVGAQTYFSASGLMPSKKVYVKLEVIGNGSTKVCNTLFTTRADNCSLPCDFGYQVRDCESFEYYPTGSGKMFPEARYKFEFNQANDVNNINVTNFSPVPGTQGNILELQKKYAVAYKIERTPGNNKHIRIDCQFSLPAGATGNIGFERKSNSPSLFIRMNNGVAQFLGLTSNSLPYNQGAWNRLIIFGDVEKKTLHFYINNKLLKVLENQDVSFIKNLTFFSTSNLSTDRMFVDNIGYRERDKATKFYHLDRDAKMNGFDKVFAVNANKISDTLRICADRDSSFLKFERDNLYDRVGLNDILEFKIKNDNSFKGKLEIEKIEYGSHIFRLKHPDYVYGEKFTDIFNVELHDKSFNCLCDTTILEVFRSPVVFIHGINSDEETFSNMLSYFSEENFKKGGPFIYPENYINFDFRELFLWTLDYRTETHRHISDNSFKVNKKLTEIKEYYKSKFNIPLGKIDVVSHSMGGLITRFYVQEKINYNEDINRFITINTPHFGTQLANIPYNCKLPNLMKNLRKYFCSFSNIYLGCENNFATHDLKIDSDIIRILNRNPGEENGILSHAIVSHKIWTFNTFGVAFINEVYNGEQNDFAVPLSSQLGGLSGEFKSNFSNLSHTESLKDPTLINRVYELLNDPQLVSSFSKKWFKQGALTFNCPTGFEPSTRENSIDITSINQNYIYGQPFQINYNIPNYFTDYSVVSDLLLDQVNKTSCKVNAWNNPLGFHTLYTVGIDTMNKIESIDSIEIYIGPGNFLQSIASYPSELEVRHRDSIKFKLYAFLRDSVVEITDYQNTQYQFATNRIKNKDYSVTGLEIGVDTIMVTYYGKTIKIPVKVIPTPCKYPYKPNVVRSSSDILCEGEELGLTIVDDFLINDWNNFTQEDQIQIYKDTTIVIYMFDTLLCGYYDTLHFNFKKSEDINLSGDTKKCIGENFVVSVTNPSSTVIWSDGTTGNILSTTSPGTFIVNVTGQNGCTSKDTIHLEYFPDIVAEIFSNNSTNVLCKGDTLILSASGGNAYQWNNGSTSNSIIVVEGGEYEVEVTDSNGCSAKDSIQVNKSNISLDLGEDVQASGSFYIIQAPVLSNVTYKWSSNGSTSDNLIVITSGTYYLTITDHLGCTAVDSIFIDFVSKTSDKSKNNFQIFPNPGSDELFILLEQVPFDPIKFQILNCNGQIIREEVLNRDVSHIGTSELSPGMYILRCVINKTVINRTWIKI